MSVVDAGRPLVERESDLAAIADRWRDVPRLGGSVVVVRGESGIGKSALARSFALTVRDDADVLWGACDPLSTPRPLGPIRDVAADLGGSAQELLAGGAFAHDIFTAVFDELRARPCVLVLDDLHWADEGTLELLRFLIRRIASTPSLVIITFRDDEVDAVHPLRAVLGDAARVPAAVQISLRPLSVEAVGRLIGDRQIDAAALHRATGGNPFFVDEVVTWDGDEIPVTVRDAVLARTVGLPAAARDFIDLMSCAPEGVPDRLLPKLGIGIELLRTLDRTGLVQRTRRGISFRHEMSRLAIADALPPGADVALHRRLIGALEALGDADPAVLAHHAVGAEDGASVVRYATLAAVAASRAGAHTEATEFVTSALRYVPSSSRAERARLFDELAVELYLTDRLSDAITAGEQAAALRAELDDLAGLGASHSALSVYEWYNANRPAAERHASRAVEVLETGADRVALGHAYATEAFLAMQNSDWPRLEHYRDRAQQVAADVEQERLRDRLEIIDGAAAVMSGDLRGRDRLLSLMDRSSEHFDEIYSTGYSNLANLDVEQRRLDAAEAVLDVSIPLTIERDIPVCQTWQVGVRGRLSFLRGDWDRALDDASEVLAGEAAPLTRSWPHLVRGLVALRRGADGSAADLDRAWELAMGYAEPLRILPAMAALAERAWLHGLDDPRLDDAGDVVLRYRSTPGTSWSRGDLAVWLARLGRHVEPDDPTVAEPYRLLLGGETDRAAAAWAERTLPYERALALVDSGRVDSAVEALAVLDRIGADAVAAKVRRELRERGVTSIPGRPRTSTRSNPAGLTARQLEVLQLLDDGLTNAELAETLFISPKTVDHHVSAILAKLQVPTRSAAAAAGRRLGLVH